MAAVPPHSLSLSLSAIRDPGSRLAALCQEHVVTSLGLKESSGAKGPPGSHRTPLGSGTKRCDSCSALRRSEHVGSAPYGAPALPILPCACTRHGTGRCPCCTHPPDPGGAAENAPHCDDHCEEICALSRLGVFLGFAASLRRPCASRAVPRLRKRRPPFRISALRGSGLRSRSLPFLFLPALAA